MNINEEQLEKIKRKYNLLKEVDCHINDNDDEFTIRQKDMAFGKIMGYREIFEMLGIENSK